MHRSERDPGVGYLSEYILISQYLYSLYITIFILISESAYLLFFLTGFLLIHINDKTPTFTTYEIKPPSRYGGRVTKLYTVVHNQVCLHIVIEPSISKLDICT
jgi:hypothetical protein